jgi:hypothetical protein
MGNDLYLKFARDGRPEGYGLLAVIPLVRNGTPALSRSLMSNPAVATGALSEPLTNHQDEKGIPDDAESGTFAYSLGETTDRPDGNHVLSVSVWYKQKPNP